MNPNFQLTPARQAVVNGLAIVGFIALVAAGIALAVYATRFVPTVVNRIGLAAVYLGSAFNPSPDNGLSVVPTPSATSTISFGNGTTTAPTTSGTKPVATTPAPGVKTAGTYPIGGAAAASPVSFYGLPDLMVTVSAIGYLDTSSADSFIASATVPDDKRPAVRFIVKNIGTNVSGTWRFEASIPTRGTFDYDSPLQQSLAPGDSIDYTLGFDRAREGTDQPITLTVDSDTRVTESNENNNTISLKITVLGD